jgi:alpha-mannosidase
MKRRELLKTVAGSGAGLTLGLPWIRLAGAEQAPLVTPIRGLIQKGGKLWQPIHVSIQGGGLRSSKATLDGTDYVSEGSATQDGKLEILLPAVQTPREVVVTMDTSAGVSTATCTLKPVRKVTVYVLPHSHHDLGYTDLQANVEAKQIRNIDRGIELAQQTAHYPVGSRFVWNLEVLWGADSYLRQANQQKHSGFVQAVKNGSLGINGMYANELTGLCRPEELMQLFRFGTRLASECGVKLDSAMISDVPGCTWGTVTAMAQAGIRYFSAAPNWFDRIGTLMVEWQDKPFWWVSPSGKEKVLVWIPWTGYAMSHVVKKMSPEWVGDYQERLDQVRFPYEVSYIRWSGHGDNAEPDPDISEFVRSWHDKYEWPKFHISSTSTAFAAFEMRYGSSLPEHRGDLTPYWEDGAGSSALETALSRSAADRLVQTEAMRTIRHVDLPAKTTADAWRDVLLYSEHTWGAFNSVSDSENKFVKDQWQVKRQFAIDADQQSFELLAETFSGKSEPSGGSVSVFNTTSWPRTEIALVPHELSQSGDRVTNEAGEAIPSQRLSNGALAVWVTVNPLAAARIKVGAGASQGPASPVTIEDGVLDNGLLRAKIDLKTGNIAELHIKGLTNNLVDTTNGQAANEFLFLPGSDLAGLQRSGTAAVQTTEHGPLVASVKIVSSAPGCNSLVRTITLAAGSDHLDITNTIDKQQAPLNPNPGKGGPGDAFAQHGNKESIQFAFPFNIENGQIRVDVPLAVMRPEVDQLPGSCKNWLPVGRWIDVSNENQGVTCITLDAPLVEIGEVSANLLGSQRDPKIWRKQIAATQKFYSWVMNNHWGTNYRAYQEGPVSFRYSLHPHGPLDLSGVSKIATGKSQPLLVHGAVDSAGVANSFLTVEPNDVLVTALKASDDGRGVIVRLFGASGERRDVKLKCSAPGLKHFWLSDLSEARLSRVHDKFLVDGWDLVTVRIDRS